MGLEKVIGKQVVQMIKDSDRVQKSVSQMKDKLVKESLTVLEKAGIDPAALPFDPIAVLNGNIPDPNSLLTPENVCSIPPIPSNKIESATSAIDNAQASFSNVIENSNKLKGALIDLQTPLASIQTTGDSVEGIINSVSNAVKVIKAIPIPTAFGAPAVALPVKVLTILSISLVKLDKIIVAGKGTVSFIAPMVRQVSGVLNQTITAVNSLEQAVQPALTMLSLVKSTLELGNQCPNVNQEDIDDINNQLAAEINEALLLSGDNSIPLINIEDEEALIASFPFDYRGFLLELVNNPNNDFPFPSRRIRATRDFTANPEENSGSIFVRTKFNTPLGEVILYNDPGGQGRYSYSTSVAILVREMKFKLDNYLKGVKLLALPAVTSGDASIGGSVRGGGGGTPFVPSPVAPAPNLTPPDLPGGSIDPPSPTGSVDPPLPPAYYFSDPTIVVPEVTPNEPYLEGTFTVVRPIKIKMTTFGGNGGFSDSTAFLRIFKTGALSYSYMFESQFADQMETITTKTNPVGYYNGNPLDPEYWPITPGYFNGALQTGTGIFKFTLELTNWNGQLGGGSGNFSKFEIEAQ
tara:strand:+ start:2640 stop:4376 length:1737 start_codon:yes stop_codon:yes gene_type:complete